MITQRAALLGFVAFCFYLIAVVNVLESYFYALTWAAIGIFGASLGTTLLSLIGLSCKIEIKRSRSAASLGIDSGVGPQISVALSNQGTLNKTGTLLDIRLKDSRNMMSTHRFVIEAVPSGASIESDLPLHSLKRGIYTLHEAKLVGSDVLGLFRIQKRLPLNTNVGLNIIVGPAILRTDRAAGGSGGAIPASSKRALQSGHGDELRGTRPYSPGDDLRHVHWKSSARIGELVVKEFEQTGRQAALVVWDGAKNTNWGSGDYNSTEWSLILCASLCRSLLSGGTSCDFVRLDSSPKFIESRSLVGSDLPGHLNDALAEAAAQRQKSLDAAIFELPMMTKRHYSTVYLVTASLSHDVVQAARYWRGRGAMPMILLVDAASLLVQRAEKRFGRPARTRVQNTGNQNIAVTAENYESQLASLRETGAQVVLVGATDASPVLDLQAGLLGIFDPHSVAMRQTDRTTV
ncbi:DUF58 domain-containing protein [bacterium]|nr:MAG: DUF58 domain-containing protein [bacterium]